MKFEHVSFNEKFWVDKTEAEFIAHESHHGLSEKQLKEAFALINPPYATRNGAKAVEIEQDRVPVVATRKRGKSLGKPKRIN